MPKVKLEEMANVEWAVRIAEEGEPVTIPPETLLKGLLNPLTAATLAASGLTTVGHVRAHWKEHTTLLDIPGVRTGRQDAILKAINQADTQRAAGDGPLAAAMAAACAANARLIRVARHVRAGSHAVLAIEAGSEGPLAVITTPECRYLRVRWRVAELGGMGVVHVIQAMKDGKLGPPTTAFCQLPEGKLPEGLVRVPRGGEDAAG